MAIDTKPEIVWRPSSTNTPMDKYRHHVNQKFNLHLSDAEELHSWSISNPQKFWIDLYSYVNLVPDIPKHVTQVYDETLPISSVPKWFDGVLEMNYTENVFQHASNPTRKNEIALIGLREGEDRDEKVTWGDLERRVWMVSTALKKQGVSQGDVVAALVSTSVEVVVIFLAAASLGAVFSSVNPDLGVEGCISRFQQVKPKILFADEYASFKGQRTSVIPKVSAVLKKLDYKPATFVIPIGKNQNQSQNHTQTSSILPKPLLPYKQFLQSSPDSTSQNEKLYTRVPFNHPLFICYSSGTTGQPKCIVHQHGVLLNMRKISMLHNSIGPGETVLQYSSTSWVMFQIMMGHLASGATIVLYDGSPMWPDVRQFLRIAEKYKVTYIGTSPRYLYELEKSKVIPKKEYDLSSLRMINVTGATLSENQYHWFYENLPNRVHLANSAGGTDTATSVLAANPTSSVYLGEIQMCGLGMNVDILDSETGESIKNQSNLQGEMVILKPFPSMPTMFWGDDNNKIYHSAYFERFNHVDKDVWAQHDWLSYNKKTKGWIMYGRSDGVLNPSGIRFGSGEIYSVVESSKFTSEISDSLCVGRRRSTHNDNDETVFLFLVMKKGRNFTSDLEKKLKTTISQSLSPRHIPKFIVEVDEIPVTINGKKIETTVKQIISGKKDIKASSTVANPKCLYGFKRFYDYDGPREMKL